MQMQRLAIAVLLAVSAAAQGVWLHRVPGLMGDEGSEGENVYELWEAEGIVIMGERSYIGPAIDYLKVPFIGMFGYNALALRAVMWIFSLFTVWLAWSVMAKHFGDNVGLMAVAMMAFSPAYLTYQRIGWAITSFPFFVFLVWRLSLSNLKYKWLAAGLAMGLGLANHIIFFASVVGLLAGGAVFLLGEIVLRLKEKVRLKIVVGDAVRMIGGMWPAAVGFWAGFGMQFIVLILRSEDQGNPEKAAALFTERLADFWGVLPLVISGSAYGARYTGIEYPGGLIMLICAVILVLALAGVWLLRKKMALWAITFGLVAQVAVMLYIVDRFTLRYFLMPVIIGWLLAGLGLGAIVDRVQNRWKIKKLGVATTIAVSFLLLSWSAYSILVPFLNSGGSTRDFSLYNRTDSAAALVDTRPLVECLSEVENIYSENVHIWNRIQYLSHGREDLIVLPEGEGEAAEWLVNYRWPNDSGKKDECGEDELCPELAHFCVVKISR